MAFGVFFFVAWMALGQGQGHPLKPLDRASPRAALKTFLDSGDELGTFMDRDYLPSPTRTKYHHMVSLGEQFMQGLDLSQVPPAARVKAGRAASLALYETLSKIQLPPLDEVPDTVLFNGSADTNVARWTIPNTEIVLVRESGGPHSGEFLFSPETVARSGDFYERVRGLAYTRPVPLTNLPELLIRCGGWLVPYAWIQALPEWLGKPLAGQALWKWFVLALMVVVYGMILSRVFRLSRRIGSEYPFRRAMARMALPAFFLLATPAVAYLALVQLNLRDRVGSAIDLAVTPIVYIAGAWLLWRLALVVAEGLIASPRIAPESIDAHLIRICTRLLGLFAGAWVLALGADQLGVPVYGIVAGLGVGGLALALAAQPTIENLIGGLSLFADKPIRVGDHCKCEGDEGTVEAIGIRSTRIRGLDRTVATIPNAALSKMAIVNFAQRDRMLIQSSLGVRYETTPDQLRYLLVKILEMLQSHPRIHSETARARFVDFGAYSLDIEVFAYVLTRDRMEFLAIQEDVLFRIMDIVNQSGTAFAFPSQTLYLGRDAGMRVREVISGAGSNQ
jgi:MscS family membrane protein